MRERSDSVCTEVESCESGAAVHATRQASRESAVPKCGSAVGVERPASRSRSVLVLGAGGRRVRSARIHLERPPSRSEQRSVSATARSIALKIQRADFTGVTGDGWRREAVPGLQPGRVHRARPGGLLHAGQLADRRPLSGTGA